MTARYFVDSNVFLYLYDEGPKAERAASLIATLAEADGLVISPQVIGEVHVNVARAFGPEVAQAQTSELLAFAEMQLLDERTTAHALELQRRCGLAYWDAQIVAAAAAAGTSTLLSEDMQDGQTLDCVTVLNPFADEFTLGD